MSCLCSLYIHKVDEALHHYYITVFSCSMLVFPLYPGNKEDEETMMQEWFSLLNGKNELIKRQIELNLV